MATATATTTESMKPSPPLPDHIASAVSSDDSSNADRNNNSNKILAQCLTLLKGGSDEHKFAGLVMVTKHVPALTASSTSTVMPPTGNTARESQVQQVRRICDAVGTAFVHRLLKTAGDSTSGKTLEGGAGMEGLSVYQHIALGVLAAFFQDETLVRKSRNLRLLYLGRKYPVSAIGN